MPEPGDVLPAEAPNAVATEDWDPEPQCRELQEAGFTSLSPRPGSSGLRENGSPSPTLMPSGLGEYMAQKNAPAAIPTPVPATLSKPTPAEVPNPIEIGSAPVSSSSRSRLVLSVGGGALIPAMFLLVMVLFLAGREGQRNSMGNVVTPLKIVGEWDALGSDPRSDRIEILRLEDQAIGRGDRNALQALQSLCQSLDPSCRKYVAIQASLIRIQQAYRLRKEVPDERL
ncbi:MAG: hypothetical protein AAGJ31_04400, partial [Verrucomicrobiota bacterium]